MSICIHVLISGYVTDVESLKICWPTWLLLQNKKEISILYLIFSSHLFNNKLGVSICLKIFHPHLLSYLEANNEYVVFCYIICAWPGEWILPGNHIFMGIYQYYSYSGCRSSCWAMKEQLSCLFSIDYIGFNDFISDIIVEFWILRNRVFCKKVHYCSSLYRLSRDKIYIIWW